MNTIIRNWKYGNISIIKMEEGDKLYACHMVSEYVRQFANVSPVGENTSSVLLEFFASATLVVEGLTYNGKTVQHVRYAMPYREQDLNLEKPLLGWPLWEIATRRLNISKPTPVHILGGSPYAICYADEILVQKAKVQGSHFWLLNRAEVHEQIEKL